MGQDTDTKNLQWDRLYIVTGAYPGLRHLLDRRAAGGWVGGRGGGGKRRRHRHRTTRWRDDDFSYVTTTWFHLITSL